MIHSKRIKQYCNMFSSNLHCTATDSVQSCVRNRRCGLSTLLGSWYCWFGAGVWRAPEKFLRIKKWNRRIKYLILSESGSKHICGDPPKSRRNYAKAEVANQRPCPTNSCLTSSFHVHVLDEVSNSGVFVPVTVIFCSSQWQMMKSNASRAQVSSWIYRQKSLCKRAGFFLAQKCWWLASQNHLKYVTLVDSLARVLENKPAHWKPFWQRFLSLLDKRRLFSAVNSQSVVWLYLTVGPLCFIASLLVPLMIFGFFLLGGKLQQATKLHKGITKLQNPCYAHRRWMGTLRIRLSGSTNWNQQGLKICSIFCDSGAEKKHGNSSKDMLCCFFPVKDGCWWIDHCFYKRIWSEWMDTQHMIPLGFFRGSSTLHRQRMAAVGPAPFDIASICRECPEKREIGSRSLRVGNGTTSLSCCYQCSGALLADLFVVMSSWHMPWQVYPAGLRLGKGKIAMMLQERQSWSPPLRRSVGLSNHDTSMGGKRHLGLCKKGWVSSHL